MKQAVRLEQDNYWYHYFLAYHEDQAGSMDDALNHYSTAVALKPIGSPWIRFSRARLYRSKGLWASAIEDMHTALGELKDRSEARKVHLELGYVYQELGDFAGACRVRRHHSIGRPRRLRPRRATEPGQHRRRIRAGRTGP